jgi:hypothetical protein
MKRFFYFITLLTVASLFAFTSSAQNKFSESDLATIDHKVDSLISQYQQFSSFISENDLTNISEEYLEAFPGLFSSPSTEVVNDLDFSNTTPKKIKVSQYVEYAREWYPNGFSTYLTNIQKDPQIRTRNNNYLFTVNLLKTLGGFYKQQEQQNYEGELLFTIEFDRQLSSFKIASIDEKGGSDTCAKSRQVAGELLASGACAKAKKAYENVLNFCPSDPESIAGIKKCDSCLDANKKPLFLTFHVLPGSSSIILDGNKFNLNISSGSGFNLGLEAGIGVELAVVKWKKGILSAGAMIDYSSYHGTSILEYDSNTVADRIDIDGDNYNLIYIANSVKEEDNLTSIQIPVYLQYEFLFSKIVALYVKVGGKVGFNLISKYKTSGTFNYRGQYNQYGGVILYGLPAYNFGTYDETIDATNSQINMLNISAFGGLGLTMTLSKSLDLFVGVEYTRGFSDIGKGDQENRITMGKGEINSLFGSSKVTTQAIGIELGLKLKIFKY